VNFVVGEWDFFLDGFSEFSGVMFGLLRGSFSKNMKTIALPRMLGRSIGPSRVYIGSYLIYLILKKTPR
jgi:hypothetical protein